MLAVLIISQIPALAGAKGKWWKNADVVRNLQLSSAQVTEIEQIFNLHKTKLHETKQYIIQKQKELNQKLRDPQSDKQEISNLAEQVDVLKLQLGKIHRNMRLEIREVLTPDQRMKLHEMWSGRKHKK